MIENNNDEVLILGLPNSGKSTLVNVLTSKKVSIIGSTPNTTRDKVSTIAEINNKKVVIGNSYDALKVMELVENIYKADSK